MFRWRSLLVAALAALSMGGLGSRLEGQEEPSSESRVRLRLLLMRFPEADANGDGVLSRAESKSFLANRRANRIADLVRGEKPAPTHHDVHYSDGLRNVMDLWIAKADAPTPLVIYFHGGGFVGGSNTMVHPEVIDLCLKSGISVASVNYTFTSERKFPVQQHDAARAIQFLREHAAEYNVDPQRFAAYGESAGAGLALWLAFHDDMAKPDSPDPVERQSTRLQLVGAFDGQTTYDPKVLQEWVGYRPAKLTYWLSLYDVKDDADLFGTRLQALYDEVSPVKHVTDDDPPVFMFYNAPNLPTPSLTIIVGIHHPKLGMKLAEVLSKHHIENVLLIKDESKAEGPAAWVDFVKKHFFPSQPPAQAE